MKGFCRRRPPFAAVAALVLLAALAVPQIQSAPVLASSSGGSDLIAPAFMAQQSTGSPPQQVYWRDRLCYGFPGCPDSYLFLVPALVGVLVGGTKKDKKNPKKVDRGWLIFGVVASFIFTAVLMQISPLKVIIYLLVPLAVGVFWWAWRRG